MNESVRKYLATIGSKGGKSGRGASKARPPELARKAAEKRWRDCRNKSESGPDSENSDQDQNRNKK